LGQIIKIEDDITGEIVLHPAGFYFFFKKTKSSLHRMISVCVNPCLWIWIVQRGLQHHLPPVSAFLDKAKLVLKHTVFSMKSSPLQSFSIKWYIEVVTIAVSFTFLYKKTETG